MFHLPIISPILRLVLLLASIVVYAVTIFAAYAGRFNTEFFSVPAVFVLILPWLAIATLIITALWFFNGHIIGGALGVIAVIASWGPITTVCPVSFSKSASKGAKVFTVMTYNMIHGWDMENASGGLERNRTVDYIINSNADIVCLQEVIKLNEQDVPLLSEEQQADLRKAYPYQAGSNKLDTKVLSKYPLEYVDASNYIDGTFDRRCYTFYKIRIDGRTLTLVNCHLMSFLLSKEETGVLTDIKSVKTAKSSYRELKGDIRHKLSYGFGKRGEEAKVLRQALDRIDGPLIVCGDFNDVPESYAYRIIRGNDLKDAYVETGFGPLVTYNRHAFWFHLDQVLYRGPLRALEVKKGSTRLSDHYPLTATFEFTTPQ